MSDNFNPHTPAAAGVEWFTTAAEGGQQLSFAGGAQGQDTVAGMCAGVKIESRATETITHVMPLLFRDGASASCMLEVWDLDALPDSEVEETWFYAGEDAFNDGDAYVWGPFAPSIDPPEQVDVYRGIASPTLTPGVWPANGAPLDNDRLIYPVDGNQYEIGVRFDSVAGVLTGRNILQVALAVTARVYWFDGGPTPVGVRPYIYIGGTYYFGPPQTVSQSLAEVQFRWETNPSTGESWTVADIEDFGTGGTSRAGWTVGATSNDQRLATLLAATFRVRHTATDPRVAYGQISIAGGTGFNRSRAGWAPCRVLAPDGSDWIKQNGGNYLVTIRKTGGTGMLTWRFLATLDGKAFPASPPMTGTSVQFDASTQRPLTPVLLDQRDRGYALLLRTSLLAGGQSLDSQPYASNNDDGVGLDNSHPPLYVTKRAYWTRVHSANAATGDPASTIKQEFTAPVSDNYALVRLMCRLVDASDFGGYTGITTDPFALEQIPRLVVRLYDAATDTQQGGTVFVYPTDLKPSRTRFQAIAKEIPGTPALTNGDQYYWLISSAAKPNSIGSWAVQVMSAIPGLRYDPPPEDTGDATFGGQVDAYELLPITGDGREEGRQTTIDACICIYTQPDTPTGFAAATGAAPSEMAACGTGDADDARQLVELAWDSTDLGDEGGGFDRYEIERDDGDGNGWQLIASLTDETCNQLDDDEVRFNCEVQYRMRVVRVDQSPSAWTDPETVTPLMSSPGFVYSTNFDVSRTVWYDDENPREFEFPSNFTDREFYGQDGGVTYRELEDRFDRLPIEVIVKLTEKRAVECALLEVGSGDEFDPACPSPTVGRRVFDPLLVLSGTSQDRTLGTKFTAPYVCVRDRHGNRWYCSLEIESGTIEIGRLYRLTVFAKERTRVPYPIDQVCTPAGSGSGSG